jgi:hypothetical protein
VEKLCSRGVRRTGAQGVQLWSVAHLSSFHVCVYDHTSPLGPGGAAGTTSLSRGGEAAAMRPPRGSLPARHVKAVDGSPHEGQAGASIHPSAMTWRGRKRGRIAGADVKRELWRGHSVPDLQTCHNPSPPALCTPAGAEGVSLRFYLADCAYNLVPKTGVLSPRSGGGSGGTSSDAALLVPGRPIKVLALFAAVPHSQARRAPLHLPDGPAA